ncbi:class I SAM-dependent methyltransferase [Geminicoccus harenae]|uniref:class I SAM-dependent methyltransferase n=1 Tax=Geminicoccus harenae TaxID=2498453 RepID=UPI00168BCB04|nr:class I SAM-dependent methyltransferase [Geminicoccus harenae]
MSDETLAFYDTNAKRYAADSSINPRLAGFLARLPSGGRILELGTGAGLDARHMLEAGFSVDATDGSHELARVAGRLLGRPARRMLFSELDAEAAYDGVYASAALLHAHRAELPEIIHRIHRALKPEGWLWASFKGGTQEGRDRFGRYYNYLDAAELRGLWSGNGNWQWLDLQTWEGSGYDRRPTVWHAVVAQKGIS